MTIDEVRKTCGDYPVKFSAGGGGLACLDIRTELAEARVYLHGAHVAHYAPRGQKPVLFMSGASYFQSGKPIRGGVPVCFPWFGPREGDPGAPAHGFARLQEWEVASVQTLAEGAVEIVFRLEPTDLSRKYWTPRFVLEHRVRVGRELSMNLVVRNTDARPFSIQEALHTYFVVSDVRKVSVTGVENVTFMDKVDEMRRKVETADPLRFSGETDRHYMSTSGVCVIHDPDLNRRITISKRGSQTTVIWNPWVAKAAAMADFGDEEWPGMLCVETCNEAENGVTIEAGGSHEMEARIRVD